MDTFERRLQQILEMEETTQAQFADRLGIQRGGLCHLLSGRNKPSFDFIIKLISSYPTINPEWLLTGKGKPYKNQEADDLPPADEPFPGTELFQEQAPVVQRDEPEIEPCQPAEKATEDRRTIEKVLIFFSDGTYEER